MSAPRKTLHLPQKLLARIEALEARENISFSAAMRIALHLGLQALEEMEPTRTQIPVQSNGHTRRRVLSRGVPY